MLNNKAQQLVAIQLVLFAALGISLLVFPSEQSLPLRVFGLLIAALGGVVGLVAIQQHPGGPNVTPTPKDTSPLLQSGIYGQIRHPIYTGVILGGLGLAMFHGHIVPLLAAFVLVPFFTYKSLYEESLLKQAYPDYAAYMTRTGRFTPPLQQQQDTNSDNE